MRNDFLNILTFDIEDWYHSTYLDIPEESWDECEGRIEYQLNYILDLLKKTNNKATFFTVALLARKHPEMIQHIVDEGHEVALHSYSHNMMSLSSRDRFETDIRNSLEIISSVCAEKVIGFRAPAWSVNNDNKPFVASILSKYGFIYDSSIFPFKTYQYGNNSAPCHPYVLHGDNGASIYEIPPSVIELNKFRIPFSGGFYFRMLPYSLIRMGIRLNNKNGFPAIVYFHGHDIDADHPRHIKGLKERFIVYANQKKCKVKFERLLEEFRFGRMDKYVERLTCNG